MPVEVEFMVIELLIQSQGSSELVSVMKIIEPNVMKCI